MAMSWQKNNSLAHLDFLLRIFLSFGKLFIKAKRKLLSMFPTFKLRALITIPSNVSKIITWKIQYFGVQARS